MAPGDHKHLEMTEALNCKKCGIKMVKAQKEYNRLSKQYPEKFVRKQPEEAFGPKTQNLGDMLTERIKQDKLYQNHLKLLAFGTPEEKAREQRRMESGFYKRHTSNDSKNTILLQ